MDVGECKGHKLYTGLRSDYRLGCGLLHPHSALSKLRFLLVMLARFSSVWSYNVLNTGYANVYRWWPPTGSANCNSPACYIADRPAPVPTAAAASGSAASSSLSQSHRNVWCIAIGRSSIGVMRRYTTKVERLMNDASGL